MSTGDPVQPLTILHVVVPTATGGMQRVVETLAIGQRRRGHRVEVAGVAMAGGSEPPLLAALRAGGVAVHAIATPGRGYLRERRAVGVLCRRLRPDVLHTHGYRPDVVDAPAARSLGVPTVTTVHGFTGGGWKDRLYERLQRRAFRRFDAVVAVSAPLAEQLARSGVRADRVHLVRNAWSGEAPRAGRSEARAALRLPAGGRCLGWVGRFTREKGADVLVRALALLPDEPLTAVLIGEGPEQAALEVEAERLGVAGRIVWTGLVPGAGRLMPAFDAFILSSRSEGTPITLFEAMAAGVPIVATGVGGVPDVVRETEALLVPPEDPAALARAIRALAVEPGQAAARTDAARRRLAAEFAEGPWLDRYDAVYHSVVAARAGGGAHRGRVVGA